MILTDHIAKTRQDTKSVKLGVHQEATAKSHSHWLLGTMFLVVPGCDPGLVFPVPIPCVSCPLLPFDANSMVTGNSVFIFGTPKKATLWSRQNGNKINI